MSWGLYLDYTICILIALIVWQVIRSLGSLEFGALCQLFYGVPLVIVAALLIWRILS